MSGGRTPEGWAAPLHAGRAWAGWVCAFRGLREQANLCRRGFRLAAEADTLFAGENPRSSAQNLKLVLTWKTALTMA